MHKHSEIEIRAAFLSDIPVIRNIALRTWPVAYADILSPEQLDYMLEKFYSNHSLQEQMDHHHFLLALQYNEPVGFASFSQAGAGIFKLHKLYVLPGLQKTGAGSKLLQSVETEVRSNNGKFLRLNVNRNNIARFFYEKKGFVIIKEEDIDIGSGYFMNDYVMEKKFIPDRIEAV